MMARVLEKEAQEICRYSEDMQLCKVYANDPKVFAVDDILDVRAITTEIEYCVKWSGYSAEYNEWVAEQYVTVDLRRKFSIERKKKEIQLLKQEKAKVRVMRKKLGAFAKTSTNPLKSTPYVALSRCRSAEVRTTTTPTKDFDTNEPGLECKIPEWFAPNEDNEDESDVTMSDTPSEYDESELEVTQVSTLNDCNEEGDTFMSEVSSISDESEENDASSMSTVSLSSNEFESSNSFEFESSNSFELDSSNSFEFEPSDSVELDPELPKQDNKGSDGPVFHVQSKSNESEVPEPNVSTNVDGGNSNSVSATLPHERTMETTRSDQHPAVGSMRLAVSSESGIDSLREESELEEYLLGFDELLKPVYDTYSV